MKNKISRKDFHKLNNKELRNLYNTVNCKDKIYINELLKLNIQNGGECKVKEGYDIDDITHTTFLNELFTDNFAVLNNLMTNRYIILGKKKIDYYKYTYRPNLTNDHGLFDLKTYDNCCNCITFAIYTIIDKYLDEINTPNIEYYYKNNLNSTLSYITAIKISIENVLLHLPNWIVRIYINKSIFQLINFALNNECENLYLKANICINYLEHIFKLKNVEIYFVTCNEECTKTDFDYSRTMRILPIIEKDVNMLICKDADGIITLTECNNIKLFEESDKIIYCSYPYSLSNIYNKEFKPQYINKEYLLNINAMFAQYTRNKTEGILYKYVINNNDFYKDHINLTPPLLAGCSGFKIKFLPEVFNRKKEEILQFFENPEFNTLKGGFDEVFIKHLFKEYLSININDKSTDQIGIEFKKIYDSFKIINNNTNIIPLPPINELLQLYNKKYGKNFELPNIENLETDSPLLIDIKLYLKDFIHGKIEKDAIISFVLCDILKYEQSNNNISYDYIAHNINGQSIKCLSEFFNLNGLKLNFVLYINYVYNYFMNDTYKLI